MDELKKFLLAFFGTTLKLSEDKINALLDADKLKPNALQDLLTADANRIATLTTELKQAATEQNTLGYNKGKGEALAKLETDLRAAYGVTSSTTGLDLVKEIVTGQLEKSGKTPGTVTEDQVLKHPLYITLQEKLKTDTENIAKEWDDKWKARDEEDKQRGTVSKVRELAESLWNKSNPVVSTDPARAANQKKLFIDAFIKENKFMDQDGKLIPLVEENGKLVPKKNEHGHLANIEDDFVGMLKGTYDLQVSDPKGSPPPPGGGAPPPPPGERAYLKLGLKVPANAIEYMAAVEKIDTMKLADADSAKAKTELTEDYNKASATS